MEKVIAIIAAHNEETHVQNTLHILNEFKKKGIIHDILVVNDGSTDRTLENSKYMGAKVVSHKKQSGKRKVFSTGVKKAHKLGATSVLMLDADIIDFPEKSIKKMIAAVRNPKKCLMATAQQYEPLTHYEFGEMDGQVDDRHSNAQRAINMVALEPLLKGNKKWVNILEKSTKQKWGLEYALGKLIPRNKQSFLKNTPITTRPAFLDSHKYRIDGRGLKDIFFQQRKDRMYVDKVYTKRRNLARLKNAYRNSKLKKLLQRKIRK
jgi:glycosyltransferase involved in cell wall biosynthesis